MTDHPVTTPEPWPSWLADLTPEDRVREIVSLHAHWCHGADGRCSGSEAVDLLLRLLDEARQQAPVPSAGHSQAIAALTRLALEEPLTDWVPANGSRIALEAEMAARREYAAGALETIAKLGEIPEPGQPGPLTHFTTAGQSRLAADNFPACEAVHWAIVSPYVRQVTCPDCQAWLGSAVANLTRALANAASTIERRDAELGEPDPEPLPPGFFGRVELPGFRHYTGWITQDGADRIVSDWDGNVLAEYQPGPNCLTIHLPTPQKRPEPQKAIAASSSYGDYEPDDDDPWGSDGDDD